MLAFAPRWATPNLVLSGEMTGADRGDFYFVTALCSKLYSSHIVALCVINEDRPRVAPTSPTQPTDTVTAAETKPTEQETHNITVDMVRNDYLQSSK